MIPVFPTGGGAHAGGVRCGPSGRSCSSSLLPPHTLPAESVLFSPNTTTCFFTAPIKGGVFPFVVSSKPKASAPPTPPPPSGENGDFWAAKCCCAFCRVAGVKGKAGPLLVPFIWNKDRRGSRSVLPRLRRTHRHLVAQTCPVGVSQSRTCVCVSGA